MASTRTKPKPVSTQTGAQQQTSQQQQDIIQDLGPDLFQSLMQQISGEGFEDFFQESVADPARQEFREQVLPAIEERGAALGAKGGSTLTGQQARAGTELEKGLVQQRGQLRAQQQQQGIGNLLNLQQLAQQPQFNLQQPGMSPLTQLLLTLSGQAAEVGGRAAGAAAGRGGS